MITRKVDTVEVQCGGWSQPFSKIDLRLPIECYGFLINCHETVTAIQWVRRIRKTYSKSTKRNRLIKTILLRTRPDNKVMHNPKFYNNQTT